MNGERLSEAARIKSKWLEPVRMHGVVLDIRCPVL